MEWKAFKMSGGGNDFLALAEPPETPTEDLIRAWCTRRLSIGADGLFVLRRTDDAVAMEYFNADGRPAELCLNGTRCAAALSDHLGWSAGEATILTAVGPLPARRLEESLYAVQVPAPNAEPEHRTLEVPDGGSVEGWFLRVGGPVFVVPRQEGLSEVPVARLGAALRNHSAFGEAGTNVMFSRFEGAGAEMRAYERGVEAETLACGIGVLATAAVGVAEFGLRPPLAVLTAGGFELSVEGEVEGGRFVSWELRGDARLIGELALRSGALRLPPSPRWS